MTYRTLRRSAPFGRETISIVLCIRIVLEGCFSFAGKHEAKAEERKKFMLLLSKDALEVILQASV